METETQSSTEQNDTSKKRAADTLSNEPEINTKSPRLSNNNVDSEIIEIVDQHVTPQVEASSSSSTDTSKSESNNNAQNDNEQSLIPIDKLLEVISTLFFSFARWARMHQQFKSSKTLESTQV